VGIGIGDEWVLDYLEISGYWNWRLMGSGLSRD
jgi:hypothetical protein